MKPRIELTEELNLQAFIAYMNDDLEHSVIVAAHDNVHAREIAAEFMDCPFARVVVHKTAQRHVRRMETSGVAWRVDTPRYSRYKMVERIEFLRQRLMIDFNVDYAALEHRVILGMMCPGMSTKV